MPTSRRFLADGTDPVGDTPEHFGSYVRDELVKWAKVTAGIKRVTSDQ
jgi:hypothetical protein